MKEDYKKITIESYDKHAKKFAKKFEKLFDLQRRKEFGEFIENIKGDKVLDLGCGAGDHSLYFQSKGLRVTAIDLSSGMIDICKSKGLDAKIMDMENMNFKAQSFDGVWAVTSLLHVPKKNIGKVIKKLYSILKKDGLLYIVLKEGVGEGMKEDNEGKRDRFFAYWRKKEFLDIVNPFFELVNFRKVKLDSKRTFLELLLRKK